MSADALFEKVLRWARGTDLLDVSYRRGGQGVGFRLEGAALSPAPMPSCSLVPVRSPGVGLYRPSAKGFAGKACEGRSVKEGDPLGFIETGASQEPIAAPCSGSIVSCSIEDGAAAEYGQALFFIRP
ncbi:MAG: biotin/lipoyl-containing protein [Elusimicrobiota bacterium]|jgi:biotin carboxyl carrier protein